jgi:hypothetical protein
LLRHRLVSEILLLDCLSVGSTQNALAYHVSLRRLSILMHNGADNPLDNYRPDKPIDVDFENGFGRSNRIPLTVGFIRLLYRVFSALSSHGLLKRLQLLEPLTRDKEGLPVLLHHLIDDVQVACLHVLVFCRLISRQVFTYMPGSQFVCVGA